jgi:hypothetical protein
MMEKTIPRPKPVPKPDYIIAIETLIAMYESAVIRRDNQYSPPHVREVAGAEAAAFAELLQWRK